MWPTTLTRIGLFKKSDRQGYFPHCLNETTSDSFELNKCSSCELAKHCSLLFQTIKMSSFPFHIVHSDVWGPAPVNSISGYMFFVTFFFSILLEAHGSIC